MVDPAPGNLLLAALLSGSSPSALTGDGRSGTEAALELVEVRAGEVLHEADEPVTHALFPVSALLALVAVLPDAPQVQIMAVGRIGVAGVPAVLGNGRSPYRVLCQVPGQVLRLPAQVLLDWAATDDGVRRLLGHHEQSVTVLLGQRVACGQRHSAEQRCAAWLLQCADRLDRNSFPVTHQVLALMLGVRRTTVSLIAAQLQQQGLIAYHYGNVQLSDRAGLEQLSCSCYAVFRGQVDALRSAVALLHQQE